MLSTLQFGPVAVDMFLRILKAIDQEVINREVQQSTKVPTFFQIFYYGTIPQTENNVSR